MVKLGTTAAQKKLFFSLGKIKSKIHTIHARQIDYQDYKKIASDLGVSEKEVQEMDARLSQPDSSLNDSAYRDSEAEMIDLIEAATPDQEATISDNQATIQKHHLLTEALKELDERELDIITARKLKEKPLTLEDLSQKYSISKERVRQIENKAFDKIQKHIMNNPLAQSLR